MQEKKKIITDSLEMEMLSKQWMWSKQFTCHNALTGIRMNTHIHTHIIMPHQASSGDNLIGKPLMWWHNLKSNYGRKSVFTHHIECPQHVRIFISTKSTGYKVGGCKSIFRFSVFFFLAFSFTVTVAHTHTQKKG